VLQAPVFDEDLLERVMMLPAAYMRKRCADDTPVVDGAPVAYEVAPGAAGVVDRAKSLRPPAPPSAACKLFRVTALGCESRYRFRPIRPTVELPDDARHGRREPTGSVTWRTGADPLERSP
jgi:hypothetical protein